MPNKKKTNASRPNGRGVPLADGRGFGGEGRDEFILEREEYLRDVISTSATALDVVSIPLNPAQPASAPSGSSVAAAFEKYEVEAISICFNSGSAATDAGKVFMKIDLDPKDAAPASKAEILTGPEHMRRSDNVYRNFEIHVPRKVLKAVGELFCRPGAVPSGADQRLYDWGTLHIANLGAAAGNLGDVIIKYRYRLRYAELSYADRANTVSAKVVSGGTVSDTACFGDAAVVTGGLSVTAAGDVLTFDRIGQYLISFKLVGTGVAASDTSASTAEVYLALGIGNSASTSRHEVFTVNVTELGQTLDVDTSANTSTTSTETRIGCYAFALA